MELKEISKEESNELHGRLNKMTREKMIQSCVSETRENVVVAIKGEGVKENYLGRKSIMASYIIFEILRNCLKVVQRHEIGVGAKVWGH